MFGRIILTAGFICGILNTFGSETLHGAVGWFVATLLLGGACLTAYFGEKEDV